MKQDEIIEMAKQIGLYGLKEGGLLPEFTAFAKLVAAKEREACAKLCEDNIVVIHTRGGKSLMDRYKEDGSGCDGDVYASAIRARSGDTK